MNSREEDYFVNSMSSVVKKTGFNLPKHFVVTSNCQTVSWSSYCSLLDLLSHNYNVQCQNHENVNKTCPLSPLVMTRVFFVFVFLPPSHEDRIVAIRVRKVHDEIHCHVRLRSLRYGGGSSGPVGSWWLIFDWA